MAAATAGLRGTDSFHPSLAALLGFWLVTGGWRTFPLYCLATAVTLSRHLGN